jgi:hypothetical protein
MESRGSYECEENVVFQNAVFTPHFAQNLLEIPPKNTVFDDFD